MIAILINEKKYNIKGAWSELTIEEAGKILDIPVPEDLLQVYKSDTEKEMKKAFKKYKPEMFKSYFMSVLEILSDIPRDVLRTVDNLTVVFNSMVEHIVVDLITLEPWSFTPQNIKVFQHKGEFYNLPSAEKMLNDTRPMSDTDVLQTLEALELSSHQSEMGGQGLAGLVAILARKDGESFLESTAIKRAEEFKTLTMDVFWEVFFCSKALSSGVLELTTNYSHRLQAAKSQVGKN